MIHLLALYRFSVPTDRNLTSQHQLNPGKNQSHPVQFVFTTNLFIVNYSSVQLPRPTVTSVSQYNAEITLCKVTTCSEACPDSYKLTGAAVYTVGQYLHVGIDVFTSSVRNNLDLHYCKRLFFTTSISSLLHYNMYFGSKT